MADVFRLLMGGENAASKAENLIKPQENLNIKSSEPNETKASSVN
jgi:hypothetical protein